LQVITAGKQRRDGGKHRYDACRVRKKS